MRFNSVFHGRNPQIWILGTISFAGLLYILLSIQEHRAELLKLARPDIYSDLNQGDQTDQQDPDVYDDLDYEDADWSEGKRLSEPPLLLQDDYEEELDYDKKEEGFVGKMKQLHVIRNYGEELELDAADVGSSAEDTEEIQEFHMDTPAHAMSINYSASVTQKKVESMDAKLPTLLPNYRNPCWYEVVAPDYQYHSIIPRATLTPMQNILQNRCQGKHQEPVNNKTENYCWRLRCFPYFFLVGAGKSATTDIFRMLSLFEPNFVNDSFKEPRFWSHYGRTGEMTFSRYLDFFDYPAEIIRGSYEMREGGRYHPMVVGDFSPSTYAHQPQWSRLPSNVNQNEPNVTTADLVHSVRPETKVIFSVREPVSRAISSYLFNHSRNDNVNEMYSYFKNQVDRFELCMKNHTVRFCAYTCHGRLAKGLYHIFINDWLKVFDNKQVLIIKFEDYSEDRASCLERISEFLGIDPIPDSYRNYIDLFRVHNENREGRKYLHEVPDELIELLAEFYRPWQKKLGFLIRDDPRIWFPPEH